MSNKKDLFGDEIIDNNTETFEELFQKSSPTSTRKLRAGDSLKGEILSIGKEQAFVSTGTPLDATILIAELQDENKALKYKVGDTLDLVVTHSKGDEVRVSRKGSRSAVGDLENLEDAFDMELPIEGRVLELVKGGFKVQIMGHKAFCPISQIDLSFVKDGSEFVGKKFDFVITQIDQGKRNIVVSRKKLLELTKAEKEGEFLKAFRKDDIVEGKVTRVETYGAFVELVPSVEGLIHVSELTWGRVKHARDVVTVGTPVRVKILKIDDEGERLTISLSLKQGGGELDPWLQIANRFPVGTILEATVEKKEAFGLFVNLAPGITGLMPKSKWKDSGDSSKYDNKRKGDSILIRVDEINFETHRLTLGLPEEGDDGSWRSHTGTASGFGSLAAAFSSAKKPTR